MVKKAEIEITINLDKRCSQCGKKGATDNGLCLDCISKRMSLKKQAPRLKIRVQTEDAIGKSDQKEAQ